MYIGIGTVVLIVIIVLVILDAAPALTPRRCACELIRRMSKEA